MDIRKQFAPNEKDLSELNHNFREYVLSQLPGLPDESEDKHFLFTVYEDSCFIGGISGSVYWNGLEIDTLWVDESQRGRGIGQQLLEAAETYARDNDAVVAFLKTVDAGGFYEKMGYQVYGVLEDRPIGTVLFHLKKRIVGNSHPQNPQNSTCPQNSTKDRSLTRSFQF